MTETIVGSYPKVYAVGHAAIESLFDGPVAVEEKVDGSQFSFGVVDGQLRCRSRNVEVFAEDGMFDLAVRNAKKLEPLLTPEYRYRCEYLRTPKHNALAYSRVPVKNLVLFDVDNGHELYMTPEAKALEASRLGLECVPHFGLVCVRCLDDLTCFLGRESFLGGVTIEGVVIKAYGRFGRDGRMLTGKIVREGFREVNKSNWKEGNPKSGDILTVLGEKYRTEARWEKAVSHLRDEGRLAGGPEDIGQLLVELGKDFEAECSQQAMGDLWRWAGPHLTRKVKAGFPEWYKNRLAVAAMEKGLAS